MQFALPVYAIILNLLRCHTIKERDRKVGALEKGQDTGPDKRRQEARLPRVAGTRGKLKKKIAAFRHILQIKKCDKIKRGNHYAKGQEAGEKGLDPGIRGTGSKRFTSPCPPCPHNRPFKFIRHNDYFSLPIALNLGNIEIKAVFIFVD